MVKTLPSNAGGVGSISDQGTKIPHAAECSQKLKKKKRKKREEKNAKHPLNLQQVIIFLQVEGLPLMLMAAD